MSQTPPPPDLPADDLAPWTPPTPIPATLKTERALIRPFRIDEASLLYAAINTSRDSLAPWVPWAIDGHRSLSQTAEYIVGQALALERCNSGTGTFRGVGLGVFELSTGRLIGGTGVHDVRADSWSCEAGYWIRHEARGRGFAPEACAATISWAMRDPDRCGLGLRRVRVICSAANEASVRVVEKLGLMRELRQRRDYYLPGIGLTDRLGYGVLAEEWDTERHALRHSD